MHESLCVFTADKVWSSEGSVHHAHELDDSAAARETVSLI